MSHDAETLLSVRDLTVTPTGGGKPIIDGLSLQIRRGEIVALVGESGSGKSMTALAITRLLPRGLRITSGEVVFAGRDVTAMSGDDLNHLRGAGIGMLFQQPHAMLDPTARVRTQVAEPLTIGKGLSRRAAFARVIDLMRSVRIPAPEARAMAYSHELSGGMAQRVMMATALAAEPDLLIADEPTTALDVTVQAQILQLLKAEQARRHFAILLITHDLTVVQAFADRIAVMYAGRIVEEGPAARIMDAPQHPYTRALIRCSLLEPEADGRLLSIPGSGSTARDIGCGCRFAPRCTLARGDSHLHDRCHQAEPGLAGHDHTVRCHASQTASAA
ncbi:dipeptide ABC transporter ATP-binding protein DppD [Tabrizicola sp. TH137]|uniref:ABC transporter ATP-binding protein n=1 Tax=Tabrizicola sp. TH137 TaxID=2067452 RepID=UPI000C796428|nr:ABC transporter ATP-binding protein [Tabrizicola sp. TH137]PLL12914.1 dipeptide ABC transporter ATP-binding protein DppD [Tabrizicola sp. TH137]